MIYLQNISPSYRASFEKRVREISVILGIQPDWLMAVMQAESRLDHTAVNPDGGATGLIQFLPSTAAALGTSTEALKAMSPVQQLEYVLKYLRPYAKRMTSATETYLAVFYPAALGKSNSYVLFSRGTLAYERNSGIDVDKDGRITKADVSAWFGKYAKSGELQDSNILLYAGIGIGVFLIRKLRR